MASIKCNRCNITFPFKNVRHDAKKSFVCGLNNCTRSYSSNDDKTLGIMYQNNTNVLNTIHGAKARRQSGFPVDNGGCQDFTVQ